ncbi:MAG: hypothetical protein R3C60_03965 [Parvularculaceae bacterium]
MISVLYLTLMMAASAPTGQTFAAKEESLLSAAASNDAEAVNALAEFYADYELWPETLAALSRIGGGKNLLLTARADYELGRYQKTARLLDGRVDGASLRAMALSRLGAYDEAMKEFSRSGGGEQLPLSLLPDYWLARAEAATALQDVSGAEQSLNAIEGMGLSREATLEKALIKAQLAKANGNAARASLLLKRLADGPLTEPVMRARLMLAKEAGDIDAMRSLSLEWRGGAFEREARLAIGEYALSHGDFSEGFEKLKGVVALFPASNAAFAAAADIQSALPRLFDLASTLKPEKAARLFFDNVEYAPPGEEGDALIHAASEKLVTLGLYEQAAILLDHQVFKRLRGRERSMIAADLAETWLEAKQPQKALAALRSTRMAGLDEKINERRRRLEAAALAEADDKDGALALLEKVSAPDDMRLRADIRWSAGEWSDAAKDYSAYFKSAPQSVDKDAAVRAATAFLLAGDRDGYRAFVREAGEKLDGAREEELIKTLGTVDREDFLDRFMDVYRGVYETKKS